MTHSTRQFKPSLRLPGFDHRLRMYELAASAAGVGLLALAQPAEAEIIYTKTHKVIGANQTLHLDLNHDGTTDFDLKDTFSTTTVGSFGRLMAVPAQQKNRVWGHTNLGKAYASALLAGVDVGPKGQFLPGAGLMAATTFTGGARGLSPANGSCTAPWANVTNRYLGLKFVVKGQAHFGWARLNVSCSNRHVTATLTGYAYETVANRPIVTGKEKGAGEENGASLLSPESSGIDDLQPVSLGRLAQGTAWQRQ
jgi:hypothetical protein